MDKENEGRTYLALATQRLYQLYLDKNLYELDNKDICLGMFSEFVSQFNSLKVAHHEEGIGSKTVERILERYSFPISDPTQEGMSETEKEIFLLMYGLLRSFHLAIIKAENSSESSQFGDLGQFAEVEHYQDYIYDFYENLIEAELDIEYARALLDVEYARVLNRE